MIIIIIFQIVKIMFIITITNTTIITITIIITTIITITIIIIAIVDYFYYH